MENIERQSHTMVIGVGNQGNLGVLLILGKLIFVDFYNETSFVYDQSDYCSLNKTHATPFVRFSSEEENRFCYFRFSLTLDSNVAITKEVISDIRAQLAKAVKFLDSGFIYPQSIDENFMIYAKKYEPITSVLLSINNTNYSG